MPRAGGRSRATTASVAKLMRHTAERTVPLPGCRFHRWLGVDLAVPGTGRRGFSKRRLDMCTKKRTTTFKEQQPGGVGAEKLTLDTDT